MAEWIYILLRKLKGFDLNGILNLYMPQFLYLVESLSKELKAESDAYKKARSRRR